MSDFRLFTLNQSFLCLIRKFKKYFKLIAEMVMNPISYAISRTQFLSKIKATPGFEPRTTVRVNRNVRQTAPLRIPTKFTFPWVRELFSKYNTTEVEGHSWLAFNSTAERNVAVFHFRCHGEDNQKDIVGTNHVLEDICSIFKILLETCFLF